MTHTSDFIVIGAGIAGTSAAAFLSQSASVTVLEAESRPGYHSTGRSAAIYIRNYGNETLRALNDASHGFLENPEGVSDASLLKQRGELIVAGEDETEALAAYCAGSQGLEDITVAEARAMVPILSPDYLAAAAYESSASDIDVDRFLQGLLRLFKSRGGRLITDAGAQTISRGGGTWQVDTPAGRFSAPVLIDAAGAWADTVAAMAGALPLGIQPMRRSAAILPAPDDHDVDRWPLFASAGELWYAKPQSGKLMVSPADEDPVEAHDAFVDDMVLAEGLHRYEQAVITPVTRVEASWAGLRSFAPDRTPVCGFDPACEGFFWLAGQGGYGVQTAPALARLTSQLCLGEAPDLAPPTVEAVAPARFAAMA